ncbi:hypothetical protein J7T55_008291 [Diaporthe amygdali]|uniref:uncharacterized protein n=1 Tax=Phomopsis amygdali TaxID=1214568 RepID=UPI0022FED642|nr:uncharacterized protein J7T55_008291 [Diaporthe amygdali]KAJ0121129.1 hypothetical protein J7T55_008291 [Diaporthe amygdali]
MYAHDIMDPSEKDLENMMMKVKENNMTLEKFKNLEIRNTDKSTGNPDTNYTGRAVGPDSTLGSGTVIPDTTWAVSATEDPMRQVPRHGEWDNDQLFSRHRKGLLELESCVGAQRELCMSHSGRWADDDLTCGLGNAGEGFEVIGREAATSETFSLVAHVLSQRYGDESPVLRRMSPLKASWKPRGVFESYCRVPTDCNLLTAAPGSHTATVHHVESFELRAVGIVEHGQVPGS